MFSDFIPEKKRDASSERSLAIGVLQLCSLCEDLLTLAAEHEPTLKSLPALTEQLEAVRASASPLACQDRDEDKNDPYALSSLGQWVWRE